MTGAVQFGRCGLRVSRLSLGTMMFGTQADFATSEAIADYALDHGGFFWDTADMYGKGASEAGAGGVLRIFRRHGGVYVCSLAGQHDLYLKVLCRRPQWTRDPKCAIWSDFPVSKSRMRPVEDLPVRTVAVVGSAT